MSTSLGSPGSADATGAFDVATRVAGPWSLAAFAIAGVLALAAVLGRKNLPRPALRLLTLALVVVAVLGLVPVLTNAGVQVATARPGASVYRVRATVVDRTNTPVEDARVWSDQGGEGKRVAGGWEFDVPAGTASAGRRLVVRAARPDAFETAVDSLPLVDDYSPALTLRLHADTSAQVRGTVVDARGRAVTGARVSVDGYGAEAVTTDAAGGFVLPAHAADGQPVLLRSEKAGLGATTLHHPAGRDPATLRLDHTAPR